MRKASWEFVNEAMERLKKSTNVERDKSGMMMFAQGGFS